MRNQFNSDLDSDSRLLIFKSDQYRPANRTRVPYAGCIAARRSRQYRRLRVSELPPDHGGCIVPYSLISTIPERNSPTLWPLSSDERTSIESAIRAWEEKNRVLKNLVVRLSEIILNDVVGKSSPSGTIRPTSACCGRKRDVGATLATAK
jgi:hypothetical protein